MSQKRNWDNLYRDNGPKLLGVIRRYTGDTVIAEDILHEGFMVAIKKEKSFLGKGSFEGWLYKIVVNTTLQYLRKNKKEEFKDEEQISNLQNIIEQKQNTMPNQEPMSNIFMLDELLEAIDILPTHHKTVFNLYVIENYKHHEIAEMLNISVGTSKSHLARGRKKIQQAILEKAKTKEEEKRYAWLFLTPNWENLQDQDFQKVFADYSIPISKSIPSLNSKTSYTKNVNYINSSLLIKASATVIAIFSVIQILLWSKDDKAGKLSNHKTTTQEETIKRKKEDKYNKKTSKLEIMKTQKSNTTQGYSANSSKKQIFTENISSIQKDNIPSYNKKEITENKEAIIKDTTQNTINPKKTIVLKKQVIVKDTVYVKD